MENIYLIGSDDVARAGRNISSAADTMQSAANSISDSMYQQQQFMNEWMSRFEEAVNKLEKGASNASNEAS